MMTLQMLLVRARAILSREDGQDLIEYALLVGLISLAAVASIGPIGKDIYLIFAYIHLALLRIVFGV